MTDTTSVTLPHDDRPAPKKFRQRGQITKWISVAWLVFIVFTAIGCGLGCLPLTLTTHIGLNWPGQGCTKLLV